MKINEFVQMAAQKGYMPAVVDEQNKKLKKDLEIKSYLSIKDKKKLVNDIVDTTILYVDGIYKFNGIDQYITYTMKCIEAYTNLEISEDLEEDYDVLCESGLLAKILRVIDEEYQSVLSLLQMQCDFILLDNSLTAHINKFLDSMSESVEKIADSANTALSGVNTNDISVLMQKFLNNK